MKKIYLSVGVIVAISFCLFFGCKRDPMKYQGFNVVQDSLYFKSTMMTNVNLIAAMNAEKANMDIMTNAILRKVWLKTHHIKLLTDSGQIQAKSKAEIKIMLSQAKTWDDAEKIYIAMGYSKQAHQLVTNLQARFTNILDFYKNNPDYAKIDANERYSLLQSAFAQIRAKNVVGKKGSIFKKVQEDHTAADACERTLTLAVNAAATAQHTSDHYVDESFDACALIAVLTADGVMYAGCLIAAGIEHENNESDYNNIVDAAGDSYNACMMGANENSISGSSKLQTMKRKSTTI